MNISNEEVESVLPGHIGHDQTNANLRIKNFFFTFILHYLDSFIVRPNISYFYINRDCCSKQITNDERFITIYQDLQTLTYNIKKASQE
jgi:hypothetical protein